MAIEVFGGRMNDEIKAEFQRALDKGTRKGIVGSGPDSAALRKSGHPLEVDELECRIGRRLNPDQPGIRPHGAFESTRIGEIDIARFDTGRTFAHAFKQAPRPAVKIVD